ncbi:MAG: hypothetical protein P8J87_20675, partial [Verrucomicrobiales bacterium]|nr:hypothetical protein [Verrucomicrobiales bacterium]
MPAAPPQLQIDEFPDWLAPMLVKELRQGMRARMFVVPFATIHIVALVGTAIEFTIATRLSATAASTSLFVDLVGRQGILWTLAYLLLIFLIPLR